MNGRMKAVWGGLTALLLLLPGALMAEGDVAYVEDLQGNRFEGTSITSDSTGNLRVSLAAGSARNFRRGSYKVAYVPEPAEVKAATQAIRGGNMDQALAALESAYLKYRYLGWAGYTGFFRAKILLRQNKFADAEQVCRDALSMPNSDEDEAKLKQAMIEAMLKQDKTAAAKKELERMRTTDNKVAAFVFNARGQLLQKEDKPKEALLQYLKTVLLFDKSVGSVRQEAYKEVVGILESLNDNRAASFKARYAQEYR